VSELRIPSHVGKTPAEIIAIEQLDGGGYLYKSMAWLNYFERVPVFSPLLYACIDARHGIEYLLFEELVISTAQTYRKLTITLYR
jgi:hypothetical protein